MNSIERVTTSLENKVPDRVPVDLHNFLVTARMMEVSDFAAYFRDGQAMAEGQVKTWRRFRHDMLILENGTAALAQACGVQVIYQNDSAPVAKEPAIHTLDEVDRLTVPDPETDPLLRELLKMTRIVVKEIGDQAFIMARADQGPFSLACEIRGMEAFMMDIATGEEPEKIYRLLDYCRQVTTRFARAQIAAGAHCTSIGESSSGPDLLSPRVYRKVAFPHVQRMVADLKTDGILLAYHICGNATPIIADMVSSGAGILEIDQKTDQKAAKAAAQGKTTLLGPVDPSEVMAKGSPALVTEKCREALENLSAGGGFILGPGCALPAITPDENIDAMMEAARRYSPAAN